MQVPGIEVVDLVWKGLRHVDQRVLGHVDRLLKSLTWFGRDCDIGARDESNVPTPTIEVVDLVWKGLRHGAGASLPGGIPCIEVVDLVWKGLRQFLNITSSMPPIELKSLTWFGRDCDSLMSRPQLVLGSGIEVVDLVWKGLRHFASSIARLLALLLKSLTWFGRDCDNIGAPSPEKTSRH